MYGSYNQPVILDESYITDMKHLKTNAFYFYIYLNKLEIIVGKTSFMASFRVNFSSGSEIFRLKSTVSSKNSFNGDFGLSRLCK